MTQCKWGAVEDFLYETFSDEEGEFTSRDYAESEGITGREATRRIQAYLEYQRRPDTRALYAIQRKEGTRTKTTVWMCGARRANVDTISGAFRDDVKTRINRAVLPDLEQIVGRNPRLRRAVEKRVSVFVDALVPMLEEMLAD